MINFFQLSFFSQYNHSPQTWLHFFSTKKKILLILIYLNIIPYLSMQIFVYQILFILCILGVLSDRINGLYKFSSRMIVYSLLLLTVSSIILIPGDYILFSISYEAILKYFTSFLPYINNITYSNIIIFFIPKLIVRSFLILIAYYFFYKLITLTTKIEELLVNHLCAINYYFSSILSIKNIIFITLLASEYIHIIEIKIQNIITSLSIRGKPIKMISSNTTFNALILILYLIKCQLLYEIDKTDQIIYTREILIYHRNNWLII